jgi:hypothetical protein
MTMTKTLAYCAFLHRSEISLPDSGVNGAPVQEITQGEMGLLWSEVEWPFDSAALQRNAVEFHRVVSLIFSQGTVVPFRLLSVFDDRQSLADFMAAHQTAFLADLERLQNLVQMECVLYFTPQVGVPTSGREYLERRLELSEGTQQFIHSINAALGDISKGISFRESKKGGRIFVLVERGNEKKFHSIVQEIPVPKLLSRRIGGPWPPAEFLSDSVKMPQIAGQR